MSNQENAFIKSINELLQMNLVIPNYQRPYKWTTKNISELLNDIDFVTKQKSQYDNFKYRIGTIILHEENDSYNIVDGQQRIITLLLIINYLDPNFYCSIFNKKFTDKLSQSNIHDNAKFIKDWFSLKSASYKNDFKDTIDKNLETVVIIVKKINEAFQLFDSQNTRGKSLSPHDLLKAFHLRAMKDYPYEMEHAVTKWEAEDSDNINILFARYLFPILNWSRLKKTKSFTVNDIETYKGIPENSSYTYAKRTRNAVPYFQITEPFIEGKDFFSMVIHYLNMLNDIKYEIFQSGHFDQIASILNEDNSTGFNYAKELFFCSLLSYYDKFHNFSEQAIKKLLTWSMMLRVDMEVLGYDSINKYALAEENERYTNKIPVFSIICNARLHTEIENIQIIIPTSIENNKTRKWDNLHKSLLNLNGLGDNNE